MVSNDWIKAENFPCCGGNGFHYNWCNQTAHLIQQDVRVVTNPKFHALLKDMAEMHDKKNSDYALDGNPYSNFEEAAASAGCSVDMVFAVLIGIKAARLKALMASGKAPNNESIQDSRIDMAVYATLRASYHLSELTTAHHPV